jgi:hypothetical protein
MKYIRFDGQAGWDHTAYWAYLDSVRAKMPDPLYRFASNPANRDLTSSTSLHDAWLERFVISEVADPRTPKHRSLRMETSYLGPRHDVTIHITYGRVGAYDLRNPEGYRSPPSFETGHGDLLVHELRLGNEDSFEHELVFSRGSVFVVQFRDFEHRTERTRP